MHISKTGRNPQKVRISPGFSFSSLCFQSCRKVCHCLGNFDLLRADCFAASASDAGAGCLSSGTVLSAIGAMKPPPVKLCSLYRLNRFGISRHCGTVADTIMACGTRKCTSSILFATDNSLSISSLESGFSVSEVRILS